MGKFEALGIPCLALDLEHRNRIGKAIAKHRLKNWLVNQKVECIHTQHFSVYSDVYNECNAAHVRFQIVTEHTAGHLVASKQYGAIARKLAPKASTVIAINEIVRNAICKASGMPHDSIRVLENGIDTTRFIPATRPDRRHCEAVWLGRLHLDKDIMNGLRAFREAFQSNPSLHLNVVGDGEERGKAENYVREHHLSNNVSFAGELADPCKALQQADIFLLSSATEGTPLAMLEALSCGLPVVSTAVGGIPDIISNEVGILAPPGDPGALARGILQLAENSDLRARMGSNARHLAEHRFSERKMAMEYIKLIEQHTNEMAH